MSLHNLRFLPDIPTLKRLCQSVAMLDAVLQPEWGLRYFSFNSRWAEGEMMASMRDGSGDGYFLLFNKAGAILKGYAHETAMARHFVDTGKAWPGILDKVPADFAGFLTEPAFSAQEATFCLWRTFSDHSWNSGAIDFPAGNDPDGSVDLLFVLDGKPRTYQSWAEEYYECAVPLARVRQVYQHRPLTAALVSGLNPDVSLDDLAEDITEIGYSSEAQVR